MLAQLYINNIAVIERASIDLDRGFTVLTGETGAGKSIIIDAIHAVLGERTSKELVRTGAGDGKRTVSGPAGTEIEIVVVISGNGIQRIHKENFGRRGFDVYQFASTCS